jgi:hypothetical protein
VSAVHPDFFEDLLDLSIENLLIRVDRPVYAIRLNQLCDRPHSLTSLFARLNAPQRRS